MIEAEHHYTAIADAAMSNIDGQRDANRLIFAIREGCAAPDLLLSAFDKATAYGHREYARGLCRTLQKAFEGSTGGAA